MTRETDRAMAALIARVEKLEAELKNLREFVISTVHQQVSALQNTQKETGKAIRAIGVVASRGNFNGRG